MSNLILFLQVILIIFQFFMAILVAYLLLLTAGAVMSARRGNAVKSLGQLNTRFLILVPAHNERKLLPELLANLQKLDYPKDGYQVHVVADNCSDDTAELARAGGAITHERTNQEQRGKGYALQWLLAQIWDASISYDAVVVLDADSIVSANFLQVMDSHLARGEKAIQAYYAVRDPDRSWSVALRYAALAMLHYLRPLGRMALGASVGLKGNGMVFADSIVRRFPWSASLTEDIEYHMALVLGGERVTFAHDAIVWAEMPGTLKDSQTQNVRWERGRMEMIRNYVPKLMAASWLDMVRHRGKRAYLLLDAVMEHLIPPFSILVGASVLALFLAIALDMFSILSTGLDTWQTAGSLAWASITLGLGLILGQVVYTFAGLSLAKAPKRVYLSLLAAPVMIVWKSWVYLRVLLGLDKSGWVRTKRNL